MTYWAVAQTQIRREETVRISLARGGFQTYVPVLKPKKKELAPPLLFPSYVFVLIVEDRWYSVAKTIGVTRMLKSGQERPARLPDAVIEELREREGRDGFIKLEPQLPKRGQRMKVIRGLFEGHLAIYEGMASVDRQRVLLELLGQSVTVELPVLDAVPID